MMKIRILISACLLGKPVRYDGAARPLKHPAIERWLAEGMLVPVCPEMIGGLPVPRRPAEISCRASGKDVLADKARVQENEGRDVTEAFISGAQGALALAREQGCGFALLIDRSPSCGSGFIYDGTFEGVLHQGAGVTAALLRENGIEVFSDREIEALEERVKLAERNATARSGSLV